MIWIFDRNETENDITIVQKPYFYYLVFAAFISYFAESNFIDYGILSVISGLLWFIFIVFMIINLKSIFVTLREISKHMKSGQVVMSGSKLSIKKPVTYTIPK